MIVGHGDNHVLLIGLVESDLTDLRARGATKTFEGTNILVKDIIVVYGKDKAELIALLQEAGVEASEAVLDTYRRGERTDRRREPS